VEGERNRENRAGVGVGVGAAEDLRCPSVAQGAVVAAAAVGTRIQVVEAEVEVELLDEEQAVRVVLQFELAWRDMTLGNSQAAAEAAAVAVEVLVLATSPIRRGSPDLRGFPAARSQIRPPRPTRRCPTGPSTAVKHRGPSGPRRRRPS